jgi:hypothetical protein
MGDLLLYAEFGSMDASYLGVRVLQLPQLRTLE